VEVVAKPGEFITVTILNKGTALESMLVREAPTDFNATCSYFSDECR
jgi:hypothetical protein